MFLGHSEAFLLIFISNLVASYIPAVERKVVFFNETCFQSLLATLFDMRREIIIFNYPDFDYDWKNVVREIYTEVKESRGSPQVIIFVGLIDGILQTMKNPVMDGKILIFSLTQQSNWDSKNLFKHRNELTLAFWNIDNKLQVETNFGIHPKYFCKEYARYRTFPDFCGKRSLSRIQVASDKVDNGACVLKVFQIPGETLAVHKNGNNLGILHKMVTVYAKERGVEIHIARNDTILTDFFIEGHSETIIENLEKGEYDIATGPLFMTSATVDFGHMVYMDQYVMVTKKTEDQQPAVYTTVFSNPVWKWWLRSFIASTICYYLLEKLLEQPRKLTFTKAVLNIYSLSDGGGIKSPPKSTPLRTFMIFYLLGSLIICTVYVGRISSIITSASFAGMNVRRLHSVLKANYQFKYTRYLDHMLNIAVALNNSDGTKVRKHTKTNGTEWDNLKSAISKEQQAVITFKSITIAHPSEAQLVDSFEVHQPFELFMTFYLSKRSPLKQSVKFWTLEMSEKGFVVKWLNDIVEGNRDNAILPREHIGARAFSIASFQEFFFVLVLKHSIASVVFIFELAFYYLDKYCALRQKMIRLLMPFARLNIINRVK